MWRLATVLVALVVVAGCGDSEETNGPTVVAAFYPLAWAAERVGAGEFDVVNLTPPGAEPHDLELSARDVERVREADLVVYVGGFQPALEDAVADRDGPSLNVLDEGQVDDPHIWLDPVRVADVVAQVAAALAPDYSSDATIFALEELDRDYRRGLADCERRELVTTHAAFGHLAKRYGLRQLALSGSSPEAEPAPRELERLVERVRESGATTVFAEPLVSDRVARTVAREVGAEVAVLDPIEGLSEERLDAGEDYLSVMRDNLATLREALGCR